MLELYKQNAEFVRTHLEWRHKLISIYFLSSAGIFLAAKWLWESQSSEIRYLIFSPFIVGAVFCSALYEMNNVNKEVMKNAYKIGEEIEIEIKRNWGVGHGIFSYMHGRVTDRDMMTYSKILMRLFRWSAIAYAGIAIFAFAGDFFSWYQSYLIHSLTCACQNCQ